MDPEGTITPDGQADESQLNPPAPEGAVSTEASAEGLTLAEINAHLGKDFKDKATALKSFKDTFSYVGKRKEDILAEANASTSEVSRELKEIKENLFYKDNPDFAPYRAAISKMGSNPEAVINSPEFKSIFEKAIGNDKDQKLKSVLVSNPRLAASKDNITKAREATSQEDREAYAVRAVMEAYQD